MTDFYFTNLRIKLNLKNNMKQIASTYTDVKSLALSLLDNAFSSDTQPVATETIPDASVTDTARHGRRFFFWQ